MSMPRPVEIDIEVLKTKMDQMKGLQEEILRQVRATNGRVRVLELWRNMVLGFCAALSVMLSVMVKTL